MAVAGQPSRMFFDRVRSTEIIYYCCPMGERFRYEIRGRSTEVTVVSDMIELFSFQL